MEQGLRRETCFENPLESAGGMLVVGWKLAARAGCLFVSLFRNKYNFGP
jgi:hypothetical protein